jgi:hypothetical protein
MGHVSTVFEMIRLGRVDLLSINYEENDSFLSQALGSVSSQIYGQLPCSFELKCNLIIPACCAPSTSSLILLDKWTSEVAGGLRHFNSTFSYSNVCCKACVKSAVASKAAYEILDFIASRMASFDCVPVSLAEIKIISLACSMGSTPLSESAWNWMQSKTFNLKECMERAMDIPQVAHYNKSTWEWNSKMFLCQSLEAYQAVKKGLSGWLRDAFDECKDCKAEGLASYILYSWFNKRCREFKFRSTPQSMMKIIEECAFDAVHGLLTSKRQSCCDVLVKVLRMIMHQSAISAYMVCERIAQFNWGKNTNRSNFILYHTGLVRDVMLRLASLRNDIALKRAATAFDNEQLTNTDKDRVLQVSVFRSDVRSINAVSSMVTTPTIKNLALAAEYADTQCFSLLLRLYQCFQYNTTVGKVAIESGYACIVQCAINAKCFVVNSREHKMAFGILSAGDSHSAPKRKLPWACPETFDEGEVRA